MGVSFFLLSLNCFLEFRKGLSWALYFFCCTRLSCLRLSLRVGSPVMLMPTTPKSTSAHQPLITSTDEVHHSDPRLDGQQSTEAEQG